VFSRAKKLSSGNPANTKIVFLKAGADALYDMAKVMAEVSGNFPAANIKSIWASMPHAAAMQKDVQQRAYFIKYLADQGVLDGQTRTFFCRYNTTVGRGTDIIST